MERLEKTRVTSPPIRIDENGQRFQLWAECDGEWKLYASSCAVEFMKTLLWQINIMKPAMSAEFSAMTFYVFDKEEGQQ